MISFHGEWTHKVIKHELSDLIDSTHSLTVAQTLELALALHAEPPGAMELGLAADPPVLQTTLQGKRRRRRGRDAEMRALHV